MQSDKKTTPVRLDDITIIQMDSSSIYVTWKVFSGQGETAFAEILRSKSSDGPYSIVNRVNVTQGWYKDSDIYSQDRWAVYYYKVRVVDSSGRTIEYGPISLASSMDPMVSHIANHFPIYLRRAGLDILIFKKKGVGDERCQTCYDPELNKTTISNCPECGGTGYKGGFYSPIRTLAVVGIEQKSNQISTRKTQEAVIGGIFANFPVLSLGDFIYTVGTGKRYEIMEITPVVLHGALVSQNCNMHTVKPSDAIEKIAIPDLTKLPSLIPSKKAVYNTTLLHPK